METLNNLLNKLRDPWQSLPYRSGYSRILVIDQLQHFND
jgi:hypothetical protein